MAPYKLKIHLISLVCHIPSETEDELFLVWNKKKIWPEKEHFKSIGTGKIAVDLSMDGITQGTEVKLELWEFDVLSSNDLLGFFNLKADKPGGPFLAEMVRNEKEATHTRYQLEWEII